MRRVRWSWESPLAYLPIYLAAAVLCALNFRYYDVGMIGDDAAYILAAKSLLAGKCVVLYIRDHPPLNFFPLGYPLFLMPWVWLCQPHWFWLKVVSVGLTATGIGLASGLYRRLLPPYAAWIATAIFALNPVTLNRSVFVMSEPLFIVGLMLALRLLYDLLSDNDQVPTAWALGAVLGALVWIRLTGAVVAAAMVLTLVVVGRRRAAWKVGLVSSVIGSGYLIIQLLHPAVTNPYVAGWKSALSDMTQIRLLLDNVFRTLHTLLTYTLMGAQIPRTTWGMAASGITMLITLAVLWSGVRTFRNASLPQRGTVRVLSLVAGLWFVIHGLWTAISSRYAWPMLPCLIPLWIVGCLSWIRSPDVVRKRVGQGLLLFMFLEYGHSHVSFGVFRAAESRKPENRPPYASWTWMQQHLPDTATILNPQGPAGYLYSGHYFRGVIFAGDRDVFRYRLLHDGTTHVWIHPYRMQSSGENVARAWSLNQLWTLESPEAFRRIYENPVETTILCEVIPDTNYMAAFELYMEGLKEFDQAHMEAGLIQVERALRVAPKLVPALAASGAVTLFLGKDLDMAERRLDAALRLRPGHPLAALNLAMLYRRTGRREAARKVLSQARAAIAESGEHPELLTDILAEEKVLGWKS